MALVAQGLTKRYAGLVALDGVSLTVEPRRVVALIGPNGAGKTTCFEVLSGLRRPDAGRIAVDDHDITTEAPWDRCRLGIARTFQIVRPLGGMSVLDNAMVGGFVRHADVDGARAAGLAALERVGLAANAEQLAQTLTLHQQKRLEIARALATEPRYLLLDECFAGLRAGEQDDSMALVRELADDGLGLLLIEHAMRIVMRIADEVVVLHHGKELKTGTPREVATDASVQTAYLGARHAHR
jgi:branched-chain amino acid transport system ATP-binding protein